MGSLLLISILLAPTAFVGVVWLLSSAVELISKGHPTNIKGTSNLQPKCIQTATKMHPTSLPVRDNQGRWVTMCDNQDSAGRETEGRGPANPCKRSRGGAVTARGMAAARRARRVGAAGRGPPSAAPPAAPPSTRPRPAPGPAGSAAGCVRLSIAQQLAAEQRVPQRPVGPLLPRLLHPSSARLQRGEADKMSGRGKIREAKRINQSVSAEEGEVGWGVRLQVEGVQVGRATWQEDRE